VWLEFDVEDAKFDHPLGYSTSSILVAKYVIEWVVDNDDDRVLLEVVL
jgi:hypothetical protein